TGTVHRSLLREKSRRTSGAVPTAHPCGRLKLMKYCTSRRLMLGRAELPATEAVYVVSAPTTQGPGVISTTADAPSPTFSVAKAESVAVGRYTTGPTPQITGPECAGDRNIWSCVSPSPDARSVVPTGWL